MRFAHLFLVSINRMEVCLFAFKSSFSCRTFRFLCLGIVSLPSESSWAIKLSVATVVAPYWEPTSVLMQMLVWRKNFEDGNCHSLGLFAALYLEFPELNIKISCLWATDWDRVSSLRWDAKIVKFDTKTNYEKQTNFSIRCGNLRSIEWYRKHTSMCKSCETIPLSDCLKHPLKLYRFVQCFFTSNALLGKKFSQNLSCFKTLFEFLLKILCKFEEYCQHISAKSEVRRDFYWQIMQIQRLQNLHWYSVSRSEEGKCGSANSFPSQCENFAMSLKINLLKRCFK
jgi:hypothetical protein